VVRVAQFYLKVHPMFLYGSCCSFLFKGSSHVFVWFVLHVKDSLVYRCITSFDPVVFFIFRQNASVPRCVFSLLIVNEGVGLSKHVTHYGPLKFSILLPYNPPLPRDRSPHTPYGDAVCSHVGVISGNLYKSGINI
jgi:hypothetical protein